MSDTQVQMSKCEKHPWYNGMRKPRAACDACQLLYDFNKQQGIKEHRASRKRTGVPDSVPGTVPMTNDIPEPLI